MHWPPSTAVLAGSPDSAKLLLLALRAGDDREAMIATARGIPAWRGGVGTATCVDVLDQWLRANAAAFATPADAVWGEEYV